MARRTHPDAARRRTNALIALAASAALALIALAAWGLLPRPPAPDAAAAPRDLAGNPVQVDGPEPDPRASASPDGTGRFQAPSVALDVPLGSLDVVDDQLEPPGFASAYWVRNLGVAPADAATGTVFVVMHSLRGGGVAPGNALIDVDGERARIAQGAEVVVDDVRYRVVRTETVDKTAISHDAGVWADTPGRLVVITCLQRPDGRASTENMVIEADRAP